MNKNYRELMSTYEQELPGADVDLSQHSTVATSGEQVSSCTLAECLEPWLRLVFTRINTVSLQISLEQVFASTSHTHTHTLTHTHTHTLSLSLSLSLSGGAEMVVDT